MMHYSDTRKRNTTTTRTRSNPRCAGTATLWVIFSLIMLFAFFTIAVEITFVTMAGRQLSAGADASALAGVAQVRRSQSDARDQAVALASANVVNTDTIQVRRNDANAADGDVVIGIYRRADQLFTPIQPGELPNAVRVRALRTTGSAGGPLPTIFASMFGVNTVNVERGATAMIRGDIGPGVIALDPTAACSLHMRGTSGFFEVEGGVVVVNSNHGDAACHTGKPTMNVEEVYVVGDTDKKFEDQVDLSGELIKGADPVPDPLADLPEPNQPTTSFSNVKITGGTHILQPGTYGDLEITGGDVTLQAGLYYITGEFKHNGGTVDGTAGVMIFIAPGGNIDVAGNGTLQLAGMSPTAYPNGPSVPASVENIQVPIFQSRSNTNQAEINGTNDWMMDGTIYVPNALVLVRGTPGSFANGLIAGLIETRGTADLVIDYDDQFPRIPRTVFLVE